ncbi:hypothetical protein IGB42_01829 [Andreprevotia sp. IGB-42]|uniref:ferredoxin n=1 Tax=Andreprevotia sp. IGB-42 TaxID=2497473 RepID=UPI0013599D7D|nr:ferredoxin [Andreprevotia sp. IGB-42]KAF0813478.1 hypothetical protein IGB42_01829 [Andreprevotia sp. IGB-42]
MIRKAGQAIPHPLNAPGDFYVEDGCCMACLIPIATAPALLVYDDDAEHCYLQRQPASAAENSLMIEAIQLAEARCIRYRGSDAGIRQTLERCGEAEQCDGLPLQGH